MYEDIENYYYGTKAYWLFLRSTITGIDEHRNFILEKNFQVGATLASLSGLFLATKEDIVEKKGGLIYSSKVFDESLVGLIGMIGKVQPNGIMIDNYLFSDKETLVTLIRNAIAHGDFKIDFANNSVILNVNGHEVRKNVTVLSKFVTAAFFASANKYKGSSYKREIILFKKKDKDRKKPITTPSEFQNAIKSFYRKVFEIKSNDGSEIEQKCREMLEYFIGLYKEVGDKVFENQIYREMVKHIEARNFTLSVTNEEIELSEKEIARLVENGMYIKQTFLDKELGYDAQIVFLGQEVAKYFGDYSKIYNALAYCNNLKMLDLIRKTKSVEQKKLSQRIIECNASDIFLSDNELAAATISMFISLYMYPFENYYLTTKEYQSEKKDLNFSLIDTSVFDVEILTIDDNPLKSMKARCDSCLERSSELSLLVEKYKNNLENVRNKGNQKAENAIESQLKELESQLETIKQDALATKQEYENMQKDYSGNFNFFRNQGIITGIRNSIAHGNYRVNGTNITFEDQSEGEVTFRASISIMIFYQFIDGNSNAVLNLIKSKEK